jgi:hypothetical protein
VKKKTPWRVLGLALAVLAVGYSASLARQVPARPTPTPPPESLSRTNPNIIEEDEVHIVERFPKNEYIRVDDRHFRHPLITRPVEFYKEDEKYFYVYTYKRNAESEAIERALRALTPSPSPAPPPPGTTPAPVGPLLSDFEDLSPARVSGRIRLEAVPATGLPSNGLWRASFTVADMNGDRIPDIVAPPSRLGDAGLHVWIGDGKGSFSPWPLKFVEDGKPSPGFSLDYGAVAVGDIDRDGHLDIVAASHGAGLVSLFGDGKGTFRVVRRGLPTQNFSSQAVALLDADGDGKLDIVASADTFDSRSRTALVRVYLYRGSKGWEYKADGIVGAAFSNSLHAWDFDRDGRSDLLTASHNLGMLKLLWKNVGKGRFEVVESLPTEIYSYHFATTPGTFGRKRVPAFADAYQMFTNEPEIVRATGITVYSFEKGKWGRHRVWRKKSGKSSQYALAMGDLDGDGLDDIVFPDSEVNKLRVFFQKPDGTFVEMAENEEPALDSLGQCVRLADLNRDGRLDIILSKTVTSYRPGDQGGWNVYLNRR